MMTTIEVRVIRIEEIFEFKNISLKERYAIEVEENGKPSVINEVHYELGRLIRFRTVKREGEGIIVETGYGIDEKGRLKLNFSDIYHREDTGPFIISDRYFELNDFLQKLGR